MKASRLRWKKPGSLCEEDASEKPGIIIIDDDANIRRTLADTLRLKGYQARTAESGAEGLALLKEQPANVVIIDLGLPDMPGIELLHRIKSAYPKTKTIILTGNATVETAIEATNWGAFGYLLKPYDLDQLFLNIRRAVDEQEAEKRIVRQAGDLQVLYTISRTISRIIDRDELFSEILRTMTTVFSVEPRGAIFLVGDNGLDLVAHSGIPAGQVERCRKLRLGECLCGRVAVSGELYVSRNHREDHGHTIPHLDGEMHGHVIVPLKTSKKVVGVLCLYTNPDTTISAHAQKLLTAVGKQIGVAVKNASIHAETRSKSLHDSLTGLANRGFLEIQLDKCFQAGKRYGEHFSVIMLDIDWFKRFNDSYGHLEGDRLLGKLAVILSREVREADTVFRYGGEEFLILLPQTEPPAACEVAERVRKAVEAEAAVTVSLGVASFDPGMTEKETVVLMADAALYRAKQNGRNRVEQSDPAWLMETPPTGRRPGHFRLPGRRAVGQDGYE